jgi:hypothetical protein
MIPKDRWLVLCPGVSRTGLCLLSRTCANIPLGFSGGESDAGLSIVGDVPSHNNAATCNQGTTYTENGFR